MFYKSPLGKKFFNHDVPALIRELKRIADNLGTSLEPFEVTENLGKFEQITPTDQVELNEKQLNFDKFFNQLVENFEISPEGTTLDHQDLKNLLRHAWNANLQT